jgi:hypothetical protein
VRYRRNPFPVPGDELILDYCPPRPQDGATSGLFEPAEDFSATMERFARPPEPLILPAPGLIACVAFTDLKQGGICLFLDWVRPRPACPFPERPCTHSSIFLRGLDITRSWRKGNLELFEAEQKSASDVG